jgi:iron(III) transport system ATP-binding protein
MLTVEAIRKSFKTKSETVAAVADVSFNVDTGRMLTLLGPSGCGKTSTLRCIAGLERADSGKIVIDGLSLFDSTANLFVPANKRGMGMVFQSYAIWPHMSVYENVAYALNGKGYRSAEVKRLTFEALARVQLENYADRPATRLSGGQQQRVAIARALAGHPKAILFDEPLSNLDTQLRADMRTEIRRLQQEIGMTALYVTHDQAEALAISDHIIIMRKGEVIEQGGPVEIYRRPKHIFTASFIGQSNLIPGKVLSVDPSTFIAAVDTELGLLRGFDTNRNLQPGEKVMLCIRPEDLSMAADKVQSENPNAISGSVLVSIFLGSVVEAHLMCGDTRIKCEFGRYADVARGKQLSLTFAPEAAVVLRAEQA